VADKKITELVELTTVADNDVAVIVDTSETETKKITVTNFVENLRQQLNRRSFYFSSTARF